MRKRKEYPPLDMRRVRLQGIRFTDIPTYTEQRDIFQKKVNYLSGLIKGLEDEADRIEAELAQEDAEP